MNQALLELADQYRANKPWKRALFSKQRAVVSSKHARKCVLTPRRCGKSVTATSAAAEDLDLAGFDEAVVVAAKTRDVAERLIWGKLSALVAQVPGWTKLDSKLQVHNGRGGYIQLVGLDKPAEIEKLRGLKMRAFHGDEPATYSSLLRPLLQDIVEPALGDVRGSITFYGTPGPTLAGPWYEFSNGQNPEWELHSWQLEDNVYFKDPLGYLETVKKRNGWDEFHPTFVREYLGKWIDDASARVYAYQPSINNAGAIPQDYNPETWVHTIGADFGVKDKTAYVVLASHPHDRTAYVVHTFAQSGLIIDDAADILTALVRQYKPQILVGDGGGMGATYIQFYNERRGHQVGMMMIPAEKREKRAQIDIINTDFRTRRLRLCQPVARALSDELQALPWEDIETKLAEHKLYDNHLCDALLYAHRHHSAYMHSAPQGIKPTIHQMTPDSPEWIELEEASVERDEGREWWSR